MGMRLLDRIKVKVAGRSATSKSRQSYQSIVGTLVDAQTATRFVKPSNAVPTLMTDLKAAGYLFGYHDAFARHYYGRKLDKCLTEIKDSYTELFGQSAGNILF